MQDFTGLALPDALQQNLTQMGYKTPTPIQAQTIPLGLEGRDVLGSAQTGTGKTAAFSIPVISKLLQSPRGSALIMLPTRELAVQVVNVIKQMLGSNSSTIKTACLIGGEPMHPQFKQLQARPRIIVGTPGRINDHLQRGSLKLHDAGILVLDETDRMLDMGFGIQIDAILKFVPKQRQTLMFSATMPKNIMSMAAKYLTNPERVEVGTINKPTENIKQEIINTTAEEKYGQLVDQLNKREGTIIVFVKTKRSAEKLAKKLNFEGHSADAIHGDLLQRKRDRVIKAFREKEHRIMVATDIAARGLDIPHIEHVINYDLPQAPEDYVHRIGRTARAGAEGSALCLVTPDERGKMNAINRLINPGTAKERKYDGKREEKFGKKRGGNFKDKKKFGKKDGFKKREDNFGFVEADERPAKKEFGERREGGFKKREGGFDGERKERNFGEKREGGFKKREGGFNKDRKFGDKKSFGERREGGFKKREGGFEGKREDRNFGEKKSFGERREGGFKKREGGFDGERKERNFGERKSFGDRREGGFKKHEGGFDGERKERNFGEKKSFGERREGGFKKREGGFDGERKDRSEGGFRGPKKFGSKPGFGGGKPKFGARKKFGGTKRDVA